MWHEELAGRVNQHVVQPRLQSTLFRQPKIAADPIELRSEGSRPSGLLDRNPTPGDFPCVADAAIETSLFLETMAGRPGNLAQPTRCARSDRQPDAAHALHREVEITRRAGPAGCERAGCANLGELSAEFFQYGFHLRNPSRHSGLPCSPNLLVTSMRCRGASQRSAEESEHRCHRRQSGSAIIAILPIRSHWQTLMTRSTHGQRSPDDRI